MKSRLIRIADPERVPVAIFGAVAGLGLLSIPSAGPSARLGLLSFVLTIATLLAMHWALRRRFAERPVGVLRLAMLVATIHPVALILGSFFDESLTYGTTRAAYSHHEDAMLVFLATTSLHLAALAGAFLVGARRIRGPGTWRSMFSSFSTPFLSAGAMLGIALAVNRGVLLFFWQDLPAALVYPARLYASYFLPVSVIVGVGLRRRLLVSRTALGFTAAVFPLLIISGSRGEALMPLALILIGYIFAEPMPKARLARLVASAVMLFAVAMFVGGALRQDDRGRSGQAGLERASNIEGAFEGKSDPGSVARETIRRLVSNSHHSVISRVPRDLPFEEDGLVKLPMDLMERLLPRFNLSGVSESEEPRHWVLNGLGFLVNWSTSVEFGLVADAWYRGGFLGLIVVGLLLGTVLQKVEDAVYGRMISRPEWTAVHFFILSGLLAIEGRDIVAGMRTIAFLGVAGISVSALARILRSRSAARVGGRGPGSQQEVIGRAVS